MDGVERPLDEDAATALANPAPDDRLARVRGHELYVIHCRPCHGDKGRGDGPVARHLSEPPVDLAAADLQAETSDGGLYHVIGNGTLSEVMPGFAADVRPSDRWLLVRHVRTFGR